MTSLSIIGTVFLLCLGHSLALEDSSSGTGGDVCGTRACLKDVATCGTDGCECDHPFGFGDGELNCYKNSEFRTEVTNDPHIRTYNNNSFDMPVPCRYLLTHAVTEYKDRTRNVVGGCEFMVNAFHMKKYGKFYVAGYDVAIRIECNNGSRYEMSIRKYGKAEGGQYDFYINATDGAFLPNGPFQNHVIEFHDSKTNLKIKCKIDEDNNLAIIEVKKCGFRIRFRPYDIEDRRSQRQVPGLAVGVNCAFHPEFESVDKVLSPPPVWAHNGFTVESIEIPGLGKMGTMMYRAYMSGIPQTQPQPNPACSAAKDSLEQCYSLYDLQTAFHNCHWILRSPRLIRCYDDTESGFYIQELFNKCIDIYCSGTSTCYEIVYLIDQEGCLDVPGYSDKDLFIASCS